MLTLARLIREAETFGSDACAAGIHQFEADGGRACPKSATDRCSQAVYVCSVCGEYDYGDRGGPAWIDCFERCVFPDESHIN